MQPTKSLSALPLPVQRTLRKLGRDICAARKRRRVTMQLMAERAMTSRQTIGRVERGDGRVSMGIYATVLFLLGMQERLADLLDASADPYVLDLDEERLPQRVRLPTAPHEGSDP
ncbi:MAG: helix-turn-helix transcriptional regulator [bacterium]